MGSASSPARKRYAVIVIGSGSAGIFAALEAEHAGPVLLVTKETLEASNTWYAQGGMAAALDPADSVDAHLRDTIDAGAGLVDEAAARTLCIEAPRCIATLQSLGVDFDHEGSEVSLGREAAHSHDRIIHSGGDQTGRGIIAGLLDSLGRSTVTVLERHFVSGIVVIDGRASGIDAIAPDGNKLRIEADAVVLATGGAGQIYSHTTNPKVATADGIAMAYAAGAEVADLEFFQFHPTAFARPGERAFLISEAIRGEGGVLRNSRGEAFMERYHPLKDLAPRDVVARAIVREMRAAGDTHVMLDCSSIRNVDVRERFPSIARFCRDAGIDIRDEPIPVAPAAHYLMGGVRTDTDGRTTIPGLYACGEVACTGVHGANRLASNSLVETVVFAHRVAEHIATGKGGAAAPCATAIPTRTRRPLPPDRRSLQRLMWDACGIERHGPGLDAAIATMESWSIGSATNVPDQLELQNLATVGRIMLEAALRREESRGAHYRDDFPKRDDEVWKRRQVFRRGD